MTRQALRGQDKGQQATIAVLDTIEHAKVEGIRTPEEAAELEVALEAAEVVAHSGRKWHGNAQDAAVRYEQAVGRLTVALARLYTLEGPSGA